MNAPHLCRVRRTAPTGFTLVELLVVIGIIALLISILLPSLNRARSSAKSLVCLSNLRQVGTGLAIYANDHKLTLPQGYWNGIPDGAPGYDGFRATDWGNLLLSHIDPTAAADNYVDNAAINSGAALTRDSLRCPAAPTSNALLQYGSHPRLMPNMSDPDNSTADPDDRLRPAKISSIADSANKLLIADAALIPDIGGGSTWAAPSTLLRLDTPVWTWNLAFTTSPYLVEPIADQTPAYYETSVVGGLNEDSQFYEVVGQLRFRHGNSDNKDFKGVACNILYADNHAETQQGQGAHPDYPDQLDTGLSRRSVVVSR